MSMTTFPSSAAVARDPARRLPGSPLAGETHDVNLRAATAEPLTGAGGLNRLRPTERRCPCCDAVLAADTPFDAMLRDVTPTMARIARIVARRPGATAEQIVRDLYAEDPQGGPLTATKVVRVTISCNRRRMAAHGFDIRARSGRGHGYYIVRSAA